MSIRNLTLPILKLGRKTFFSSDLLLHGLLVRSTTISNPKVPTLDREGSGKNDGVFV